MKLFLKTILGFLILLISISCTKEKSKSTTDLLNGKWKLKSVEWLSGAVDQVPEENSYYFILNSSKSGNTFSGLGGYGSVDGWSDMWDTVKEGAGTIFDANVDCTYCLQYLNLGSRYLDPFS